jgi:drug/metabolite transporter (DMT)-like permease
MNRERTLAYVAFGIVCIVWGTTYLAIRIAVETIPPFLLTGFRYTAAGLVMLAIGKFRGERLPTDRRTYLELVLIGTLMVGVGNLAVVWSEQYVESGMAALLVAAAPFWIAVLEAMRPDGERLDLRRGLGMLVGFAGVAMLVAPHASGHAMDGKFIAGAVVIQLGSIGWQYGTMRAKYRLHGISPMVSSSLQMLFGGVIVAVAGSLIGEWSALHFTPRSFSALVYLAVFGSIIAFSAYVYALSKMRTTSMSLYAYVNPAVAVLLGWLVLREELTWLSVVAMVIILAGVAIVQTAPPRKITLTASAVATEP